MSKGIAWFSLQVYGKNAGYFMQASQFRTELSCQETHILVRNFQLLNGCTTCNALGKIDQALVHYSCKQIKPHAAIFPENTLHRHRSRSDSYDLAI